MGNSSGKEQDQEPEGPVQSGVRTSASLIRRLANAPDTPDTQYPAGQHSRASHNGEAYQDDGHTGGQSLDHEQGHGKGLPVAHMQEEEPDEHIQHALERSRRVGQLLLRREQDELETVKQYADDLIQNEYRLPQNEAPCSQQRDGCLQCYQDHEQDCWRCKPEVDAYTACVHQMRMQQHKSEHDMKTH
ncbi:hypothetical protein WJX84_012093 [Apatococcus fuscideae]|uniref:Uncharacterized protein n=1 Tax=Apatococcus fuscideae TaxID=2026836 RepID=A0AAW1T2V0_9CHLO